MLKTKKGDSKVTIYTEVPPELLKKIKKQHKKSNITAKEESWTPYTEKNNTKCIMQK